MKNYYRTYLVFAVLIFFSHDLLAQKKKNKLIMSFEGDAGAPVILSNKAFRETYSGAVCAGSSISFLTPNLRHSFGLKYQHGNYKAGLNTFNINQDITTQIFINGYGLRYGYYIYRDETFNVSCSVSVLKSFATAKETKCEPNTIKNISFYSIQSEVDFFLRAQDNVYAGLKIAYQNNLHPFNPNDFCLNNNNIFAPSSYQKNVNFLLLSLSVKIELFGSGKDNFLQSE